MICIVFHTKGILIKLFDHEWAWSQGDFEADVELIYAQLPEYLHESLSKSLLDIDNTSYCIRKEIDSKKRNDIKVTELDVFSDKDYNNIHKDLWNNSVPTSVE